MRRKYPRKNTRSFFVAVAVLIFALGYEHFVEKLPHKRPDIVEGRVMKVHDGDTFTMLDPGGQKIKVRLYGIDAPELAQPHGQKSGAYLRKLIDGREVRVSSQGYDQYKRLLGLVELPLNEEINLQINAGMIADGYAWVYENYCKTDPCGDFRAVQKEARESRKGLWSDRNPIAPWEYRRQK